MTEDSAGQRPSGASSEAILSRLEMWGMKLGLERIRALLSDLGHPERQYPCVLVAGTNGKGSTAAMLSAITKAAGYRTGFYSSPHLEQVEERIRIDGRAISTHRLSERLERVLAATARLPTYFEAMTAAAYYDFSLERVDLAIVEVGLGGRLDATNACDAELAVVTPIASDHQEHLGTELSDVAREKAGIFRQGRPALTWTGGEQGVASSLAVVARETGADWISCGEENKAEYRYVPPELRASVELVTPERCYQLETGLLGSHQVPNLVLAVRAAEVLARRGFERVGAEAISEGIRRCVWPGRLERVELPDGRWLILDGAHNLASSEALVAHLEVPEPGRGTRPDLLYGSLRGKGAEQALEGLSAVTERMVLTRPAADRSIDPRVLLDALNAPESARARAIVSVPEALDAALDALGPGSGLVVCGSLYLVGEVRSLLRRRFGVPPAAVDLLTG